MLIVEPLLETLADEHDGQRQAQIHRRQKQIAAEQVEVWIKVFRPSSDATNKFRSYEFPANMKTFKITGTYDDASTWSSDLSGTGAVDVVDVVASVPANPAP